MMLMILPGMDKILPICANGFSLPSKSLNSLAQLLAPLEKDNPITGNAINITATAKQGPYSSAGTNVAKTIKKYNKKMPATMAKSMPIAPKTIDLIPRPKLDLLLVGCATTAVDGKLTSA